jgi:hypothetical protein
MTALQDWRSIRTLDPRTLKAIVWDAIRSLSGDEPSAAGEPRLIRRGVERC